MKNERIIFFRDLAANFFYTVYSVIRIIFLSDFTIWGKVRVNSEKNNIVILGNGPSLLQDVEKMKEQLINSELLCVNYFANTDLYTKLKPKFYFISAPEMIADNPREKALRKSNELFDNMVKKTKWEMHLFLISDAKKSKRVQKHFRKNKYINVHYYNNVPVEGYKYFSYFCWKYNIGLPRPHNVLIPSLIFAVNNRFRYIYITGADHSWLKEIRVDENNNVLLKQEHFYDKGKAVPDTMKKGTSAESRRLHEVLHKFYHTFRVYHMIRDYAEHNNSIIYNVTTNSYIDAFLRKK